MEAGTEHPRSGGLIGPPPGGRLVGIDLGTTNSALAWLDASRSAARSRPRLFEILQLVAAGETGARPTLPSFLYFPTPAERAAGTMGVPWNADPDAIAGILARDHGSLVPARQIASAKSWLSNPAVDRRAPLLPWAEPVEGRQAPPKLSPVEASARLLAHLREAWNHAHGGGEGLRLEDQEVVLTVPASFDEEARELTVEAARGAGLERLTLLEEPLAAVYAWIASHPRQLARTLGEGQLLLVCDVGGGTTDFSLIRAAVDAGRVVFERVAIGEHLLLGGDNVDLALAALAEHKLTGPAGPLDVTRRQVLRRLCSAAKERLLAADGPERVAITLLGSGRGVVSGTTTTGLTREEALAALDQFLPIVPRDARPEHRLRPGLRELGLPYESDPAVTRHLAAFLARAARQAGGAAADGPARPDAVLFNGGFFTPPIARERILEALTAWFGNRPSVLANDAPEAAVAVGAAFYAALRRDPSTAARLLIRAGSARAYYVAVQSAGRAGTTAVCVMPRGTQEGARLALDRDFTVVANQPAAFTLLSSPDRTDALGDIVTFTEDDEGHRHAPLVTALRYGRRSRRVPLSVRLSITFTELGTLELWCEAPATGHRWRLQFNLRGVESGPADEEPDASTGDAAADQVVVPEEATADAERLIRMAFDTAAGGPGPELLVGELEATLGHGKHAWPLPVIRRLADGLLGVAERRRVSARHEARWLNLTGFCLRPGFGTPLDPWRVGETRKVYASGLAYPKDVQCQVEWLVLWQRVSAGFTAGQQQELASRLTGLLGVGARKPPHLNAQMAREGWRLLAALERLDRPQRTRLGDELMARIRREPRNTGWLWAIGRLGARRPFYGPLNAVVAPATAERWIAELLALKTPTGDALAAAAQIGARTGDPVRDISPEAREAAVVRLEAAGAPDDVARVLREALPVDPLGSARVFGETLPEGLQLDEVPDP